MVKEWLDEMVCKRAAEDALPPVETEEQKKKREQDAHDQRIAGMIKREQRRGRGERGEGRGKGEERGE